VVDGVWLGERPLLAGVAFWHRLRALGNTARVVLAMVKDDEDEDQRILEVVKSNGGAGS
jgi:hypothetical protein